MTNRLNEEPLLFAIADSLWFSRCLPEFPVESGWYLEYCLIAENGNIQVPVFRSVLNNAFPNSASHEIMVNPFPPIATNTNPGLFTLVGWATDNVYRHEIYRGVLTLTPNFASGDAQGDQRPFELQMVEKYRAANLRLAEHELIETDVQRMRMVREAREKIRKELNFWEERYTHYKNLQDVRNGRPDPMLIRPVFAFF